MLLTTRKEKMVSAAYKTEERTPITVATSRWIDSLYRNRSSSVRDGLRAIEAAIWRQSRVDGTVENKEVERIVKVSNGLGYEVFHKIYDPDSIEKLERPAPDTEWVELAHMAMDSLPSFEGTVGDPDMAAIATNKILLALEPAVSKLISEMKENETSEGVGAVDMARALIRGKQDNINKEIADIKSALTSLDPGLGESPPVHEQESTDRLALANRLSDSERIKKCLALVGALRRYAEANRTEIDPRGKSEVYGLEQGNDLSRVLPQELAGLRHPALRSLTLARYTERTLQQYRLQGVENQGRGPMVVMVDESSSMRGDCHLYAMAIAIACVGLASRENRPCTVISFNSGVRWVYRVDSDGKAYSHYSTNPDFFDVISGGVAEVALAIATSSPRGGTNFVPPLRYAMELNDGIMNNRADLILVTDGYANVPTDIIEKLEEAKKKEMRLYGFTVGGGSLSAAVSTICDKTLDIDNATDEEIGRALA
jgi:uncharacterized protein with von Willebrand factor type A (vWA) domain